MTGANRPVDSIDDTQGTSRLFEGPSIQQADIAYGFLRSDKVSALAEPHVNSELLDIFPNKDEWPSSDPERKVIPLVLSEFLAYKSALAYLDETELEKTLKDQCQGITHFCFFDSTKADRKLGDTQGYGFLYQNRAYIIMRGTSSAIDWRGNLNDRQTTQVSDKELSKLGLTRKELEPEGNLMPPRHLGFCIGWAAVRNQVEDWIESLGDEYPYIFSGHSLGGALAFIGAYEFRFTKERKVAAVITFGAPIAGSTTFAEQYNQLLGPVTVRFEAKGDSVPRIMQRRYYRLYTRLRQAAQKIAKKRNKTDLPEPVGFGFSFAEQPPLNRDDMESTIEVAWAEYKKRSEEAEATPEQSDTTAEDESTKNIDETPVASDEIYNADSQHTETSGSEHNLNVDSERGVESANSEQSEPTSQKSPGDEKIPVVVIGIIVMGAIAIGGWIFAKRKLASHNIQQRYALYLSTLSYQRLRELRPKNLYQANKDLYQYKKFIRGNFEDADSAQLQAIKELPFELNEHDKIDFFLSAREENIV